MEFDYVIVGAGAAGCVVAGRLAEQAPGATVLLVEYGGGDRNPLLHVPKGFYYTLRGDRYLYRYPTQPAGPGQRPETWLRGKVLGGCTAVNGMMWSTGAPADWETLRQLGNPGWGWAQIGPAYQAIESRLGTSIRPATDQVSQAILKSAIAYGWEHVADFNASDAERIAFTPSSIHDGRRATSYRAFVRDVRNITVATRTKAGYLLFRGNRVTGVRARHGFATRDLMARREVIVCAGTVETPLLLERSGIGHPDVLSPLGIAVRAASPRVGERVFEQRAVTLQVRLARDIGPDRLVSTLGGKARQVFHYIQNDSGLLATAGYDLVCQFKSSTGLARPDIQGLFVPMAIDPASSELRLARHSGILFVGYQIRPESFGSIHASGPDPGDSPVITTRYLETDGDRAATGAVLGAARGVLGGGPVAELIGEEEFPGPAVATPEEVVRYALDTGTGIYHAVGSAAMGPRDDDVVDPELRVRGVEGLRVADASVLPGQVSGNTAAPAMAVGWRAADLVLGGSS
jgi:choline dehydrogenase-like flavoprotein